MAGQITALQRQKRNTERVSVYVDGAYAFALPALEALSLARGQHLSDEEIASLKSLDLRSKGYDRAVAFLAVRPRSVAEVRQRLERYRSRQDESLTPTHIDWITDKLVDQGYLNDEEFARFWVEQRNRFKPRSPRALRYELRRKGIADGIIDRTVDAAVDPKEAALRAAESRLSRLHTADRETFRHKLAGFLQRRGFAWPLVREVVDELWEAEESSRTDQ